MGRGVSEKTKKLTLSAVLSAMGVVLLIIGAFIEVLDLSMAAFASFFCIFSVIEMGKGYPWMIYSITGVLAIVLMPQGLGGWFYLLFFGYYPIVKEKVEKLFKPLAWGLKLLIFNAAITVYILILYFLFFGEYELFLNEFSSLLAGKVTNAVIISVFYAMFNFVFVIYDIALTRLITLYLTKLRKKLGLFNRY